MKPFPNFLLKLTLVFVSSFFTSLAFAQQDSADYIPAQSTVLVEAVIGNNYNTYQVILSKQIGSPYSKYSFYSMVNYDMYHDENTLDNYFLQSIFFYSFTEHIGAGVGINSKPFGGTKPIIALSYSVYTESIGLYIQPSYETHKDGLFELFALFNWAPNNGKTFQPYFKLEAYTSFGDEHSYSYHNWRLGLQYKIIRLGPALNMAYFGTDFTNASNWGGFVSIRI